MLHGTQNEDKFKWIKLRHKILLTILVKVWDDSEDMDIIILAFFLFGLK